MMKRNLGKLARRILLGASVGLATSLAGLAVTWGQVAPPPVPDVPAGAEDAAKDPKDQAKGATEEAKGTAQGAKDATKGAAEGAKDAAKDAAEGATDAAKNAADPFDRPADDAAKTGRDAARDATNDARDTARDAARGARDAAPGAVRGARDAADDVRDRARDTLRDEPQPRDSARTRDERDAARDTTRDARDSFRDERDDLRDPRRDARDTFRDDRDPRDTARDARDRFRDEREDFRDAPRDERRDLSRDARDEREEFRGSREDFRARESSHQSFRGSARADARIRVEDVRAPDIGLWFGRSTGDGLLISDVATTGPTASVISRIGFREGDQILSVDGYRVARDDDFIRYLFADEVLHEEVPVVVWRDGRRATLYVEPIRLLDQVQTVQHDPLEDFGVVFDDRYPDRIVVWRIVPRSPAFYAGIQPGDVITTFHGQRVTSPQALVQLVQRTEPGMIALEVNRDQRVRQLDVELPRLEGRFEGRVEGRTALRPEFDDPNVERLSERREDRIEDRREMRTDGGTYVAPRTYAPAAGPVRRLIFPRLRGR